MCIQRTGDRSACISEQSDKNLARHFMVANDLKLLWVIKLWQRWSDCVNAKDDSSRCCTYICLQVLLCRGSKTYLIGLAVSLCPRRPNRTEFLADSIALLVSMNVLQSHESLYNPGLLDKQSPESKKKSRSQLLNIKIIILSVVHIRRKWTLCERSNLRYVRRFKSRPHECTSWLLKEAKFGRLPLLETTLSSLSSIRCAPFWGKISGVTEQFSWCDWNPLTVSPGVTEPYHLALLNRITWRYWTVSPGVTGQFHLALLDSFTWLTEPQHLMLLDSFTWARRYWTVSPDVTGQFRLSLLNLLDSFTLCYWNLSPDVTGLELFNVQRPTL